MAGLFDDLLEGTPPQKPRGGLFDDLLEPETGGDTSAAATP